MKKALFVLVLLIISLLIWKSREIHHLDSLESSPENQPKPNESIESLTRESIQEDIQSLKSLVPSDIGSSDFFEQVIDFQITNAELILNFDNDQLIENSVSLIKSISECIKDHCHAKADKNGFFDPTNTFSDKILARNLDLLIKIESVDKEIISKLDFEEIFNSQNEEVQTNAINLYIKKLNNEQELLLLLDQASNIVENKKGFFFNSLLNSAPQEIFESIISTIKSEIKDTTGLGKVDILESIDYEKLNENEKKDIFKSFCNIQNPPLKKVFESRAKAMDIDIKEICN